MVDEKVFWLFGALALIFGLYSIVKGRVTVSLTEDESDTVVIFGGWARALGALLIASGAMLIAQEIFGFMLAAISILLGGVVSLFRRQA